MIQTENLMLYEFEKQFGDSQDVKFYFAPGRVNLIGEHTDYTGGLALPFAISYGTYILARPNDSATCRVYSMNFNDGISSIDMVQPQNSTHHWSDYLRGIISEFSKIGITFSTGIDALIYGNIPNGSGLSSSASLELGLILALTGSNGFDIPENGSKQMIDYCLLAQKVENNFIGVNCGIMDQFVIGNGKENQAIMLDCYNLDFHYIPFQMNYELLVMNTKKSRRLQDSKYNERRDECEKGFAFLQSLGLNASCLGRVSLSQWEEYFTKVQSWNPTIWKRLQHVITENDRVRQTSVALQSGDYAALFELVNQSGISLRENFEVTGEHLDAIVSAALTTDGVLASRMTGGGFGGCAIAIVEPDKSEEIIPTIREKYIRQVNIEPEFYCVTSKTHTSDDVIYKTAYCGACIKEN